VETVNGIDMLLFVWAVLATAWAMWERRERGYLRDEVARGMAARRRRRTSTGEYPSDMDTLPSIPAVR